MKYSLTYIALAYMVAMANAATVTFNVIAPGASDVQVSINGQQTKLNAKDPAVPIFSGQADAPDDVKYKYVVGGTAEEFDRSLEKGRTATRNDFYNRPVTYANIPQLPWPIKNNPQWTRAGDPSPLFDSNYIPTVFITGDAAEMDNLVKNVPKDKVKAKLTLVDADGVHTFQDVTFGIHGAGKKKNAKQSWNWELNGSDTLYGRTFYKARHMEEDPTQMREKLYADILQAMGTYANEANMIRLFINGEGFGTFNLLDDVNKYSYVNALFFNGKPPAEKGPLYDGASGASFAYSATGDYYSFKPNSEGPADYTALNQVCKEMSELNYADDKAVSQFGKEKFDFDQFIRFMVMEYLTGDWDGYWQEQTNDGAYQDPTDKKWYYLGQDYDATFGVNLPETLGGKDFVKVSYADYPQRFAGGVVINNLLKNPGMKTMFETYLKDTVEVLFNNVTLTNRVLAYHDFISPDLKWDRSITQKSPGTIPGWTYEQTSQNLWQGVSAAAEGLGGAEWGLVEWIVARAQAVATEFKITITEKPVGPPTNGTSPSGSPSSSGSPGSGSGSSGSNSSSGGSPGSSNSAQEGSTSGASSIVVPSALVIGAISLVSSMM